MIAVSYGRAVTVDAGFDATVERVRTELQAEGFGVLTEIDVAETLKAKLGVKFEKYLILGACNPPLAHEALKADRSIGLLLPCNIVVRALNRRRTLVEALNPKVMIDIADKPELEWVAEDAAKRLDRVLNRMTLAK